MGSKEWYWKNRTKALQYKKEHNSHPSVIFTVLKHNAKKRGILFYLSLEEFIKWYSNKEKVCFYCKRGVKQCLKDKGIGSGLTRLTIDRKNNNLGYIFSNLVLACYMCNHIKGDYFTVEEMIKIGKIISTKEKKNGDK